MSRQRLTIDPEQFDAVIFDMDGVVTQTAHLHAGAWKKMFDAYLQKRSEGRGENCEPFSIEQDYSRYVDGKARYDGVRDFLASRGISLPEGHSDDDPEEETIRGLGNRKNAYFQHILEEQGVERYESTLTLIDRLREAGIKVAIISASKNARSVLAAAGVDDLFDTRVDGIIAEKEDIPGKPAPDLFLVAAKRLGAAPPRVVVVEDAPSGVQAGKAGGFGLVIGVHRTGQRQELEKFADRVVADLDEVDVAMRDPASTTDERPSALGSFAELVNRLGAKQPVVFLDYDGTLTPIVDRPEEAKITEEMRQTVRELARLCPVAIVSGRDLKDVRNLVGVQEVIYAGSHGFDIAGPKGNEMQFQRGTEYLPALDQAEQALQENLQPIEGAQIERKKFAIAVHYRRVPDDLHGKVEEAVDAVLAEREELRKTSGKKIFELRPDLDWDKGKALLWLLEQPGLDGEDLLPIYVGDDLTDEDALRETKKQGIGILVRDENRPTHAHYVLDNTKEVREFLRALCDHLKKRTDS
ncbi:trehalose-phosphatase [Desulfuromonas sp. AOP6]|uniref:trehalose-phosphatase n=1 Tax=Desulfuromonas sp. AOP6 TaxID=1566351 RepID=UPI00127AD104|nr:trehalose-phosphatase [Desulfuromonas sp. AOP6]BCA79931.1 hypothetical protein AOP6_1718 [Desulfuromonas sp. AOP6]